MRNPFKKHITEVPLEDAHGGSGKRRLLLSQEDDISSQMEAMTKAFLEPGAVFDWHDHTDIDEFFVVTQGTGVVEFEDGTKYEYAPDDLVYMPANTKHRIQAKGNVTNEFYFIRVNH
jgi:quercetin dioxygenase-like cupin family protein